MKRMVTITIIILIALSFLVVGSGKAEAARNDAPQVRAGLTIVFGQPFVNAVAREIVYAGPAYDPVHPVHYRHAYPSTRYVERTKIIYGKPRHFTHGHTDWDHGKRYRDEWRRHENRHDRNDAQRDHDRSAH